MLRPVEEFIPRSYLHAPCNSPIALMPSYKKYFVKAIKANYPRIQHELMELIEHHFSAISIDTRFAATSTNPVDRRLDFSAYFLALIMTLDQRGEDFEKTRKICLEVVGEYVRPKNKLQAFMKRLPPLIINTWLGKALLKKFTKMVSQKGHEDGFLVDVITDKAETFGLGYGIDILECGICKLFKKHRYEKYTSILCEVDEITSGLAGLKLIRTSTIALGAHKCDFRFMKKTPDP